jgi:hypothetical protein
MWRRRDILQQFITRRWLDGAGYCRESTAKEITMKSFLLTALSAALIVPTVAAPALAQSHANHGREVSRAAAHHEFRRGEKFDRRYASNYREINYRSYKRLKAPPRGYHWVRSGNDALLVAVTSGVIASIVAGTFQ